MNFFYILTINVTDWQNSILTSNQSPDADYYLLCHFKSCLARKYMYKCSLRLQPVTSICKVPQIWNTQGLFIYFIPCYCFIYCTCYYVCTMSINVPLCPLILFLPIHHHIIPGTHSLSTYNNCLVFQAIYHMHDGFLLSWISQ